MDNDTEAYSRQYAEQAEKLSLDASNHDPLQPKKGSTAVEAKFITPLDAVIETADGKRLPTVPPSEAAKLNLLKHRVADGEADGKTTQARQKGRGRRSGSGSEKGRGSIESHIGAGDAQPRTSGSIEHSASAWQDGENSLADASADLGSAVPPSQTHPLFPPLPLYGPPSRLRNLQCKAFRMTSFMLSLAFLGTIVLGAVFTSIMPMLRNIGMRLTFRNPDSRRPLHQEEERRKAARQEAEREWVQERKRRPSHSEQGNRELGRRQDKYQPTEGGPDPLVCDVGYYARRVGLDVEEFEVQTEDGFVIDLWHVYDPSEYVPCEPEARRHKSPNVFIDESRKADSHQRKQYEDGQRRYPVLLMHGLLQSAGAYCTNDEESLAFYLCKSGYDVWLGNNRCGFNPKHTALDYYDPRMWAWNIRQMGVMDLPALVSRVLLETGFEKLGLVCHSQGTTQTFVALAKQQRPDLGNKISVFCALAPAVYAGPLIGKMCFKFMRVISPGMFRIFFGIHAFIPIMMTMHGLIPARIYGAMGYLIFSFLFSWSDARWDRGLRDRMFQFAPVYVSAESMRWWLGRECFAHHKCILATREDHQAEEEAIDQAEKGNRNNKDQKPSSKSKITPSSSSSSSSSSDDDDDDDDDKYKNNTEKHHHTPSSHSGKRSWYDSQSPPMALWIAGSDDLVDGRRLLRRFHTGREPHVRLVHAKIIDAYEHLDVLWAMDMIEQVGQEVRDVIWKTIDDGEKGVCRVAGGEGTGG